MSTAPARYVCFCFDDHETTPLGKHIAWQTRPKPAVEMTAEMMTDMLRYDQLVDFKSIISSREGRGKLSLYLCDEFASRTRQSNPRVEYALFIGADEMPSMLSWEGDKLVRTDRPDLVRALHGEADISCIFGAHVLRNEMKCSTVEVRTCDTDLVVIGLLNSFEGLVVRLSHFCMKQRDFVHLRVDIAALSSSLVQTYQQQQRKQQ